MACSGIYSIAVWLCIAFFCQACEVRKIHEETRQLKQDLKELHTAIHGGTAPYVVILGIAQDAGYPQAACHKECCSAAWQNGALRRMVACIALVDPGTQQRWIIDATPDFPDQLRMLDSLAPVDHYVGINGIFLTHAHIGHYTGLMHLGHEAMGAVRIPVYAMPRMEQFLRRNGPWDQLVNIRNIVLHPLRADSGVQLNEWLSITPFLVPHRDEYSETVGFRIKGPSRSLVYIPDIDKWRHWQRDLQEVVRENDYLLLDATFYADGEVAGRSMDSIPHPFVVETMRRLNNLSLNEYGKVHFIHMNHTNPLLREGSTERRTVFEAGYNIAEQGRILPL